MLYKHSVITYLISVIFLSVWMPTALGQTLSIGVLAFEGKEQSIARWNPTATYLSDNIQGHQFKIIPLTHQEIKYALVKKQIDFILTNPGHYVQLKVEAAATRIATFITKLDNHHLNQFSSVIFTLSSKNINRISDLNGKTIAAVNAQAFGGFQLAQDLLLTRNINILTDMKPIWLGFPQTDIVKAVLNNRVDVGIVRSGILEKLARDKKIELNLLTIIHQQYDPNFPLLHSVDLYPEWPFAQLPYTNKFIAKQVAILLMQMPPMHPAAIQSRGAGWTIPVDYSKVHKVLKRLKVKPYRPKELTLSRLLRNYWLLLSGITLILIVSFTFVIYFIRMNKRLRAAHTILDQHDKTLIATVQQRTVELKQANTSLQIEMKHILSADNCINRCTDLLQELYSIFIKVDIDHQQQLDSVIDIARRYTNSEYAVLSIITDDRYSVRSHSNHSIDSPLSLKGAELAIKNKDIITINHIDDWSRYIAKPIFCDDKLHCLLEFASSEQYDKDTIENENYSPQLSVRLVNLISLWISHDIAIFDKQQQTESGLQKIRHRFHKITKREKEVLYLLIQGQSIKLMAKSLKLSPRTIEMHRASLIRKTNSVSSTELVQLAVFSNIFPLSP